MNDENTLFRVKKPQRKDSEKDKFSSILGGSSYHIDNLYIFAFTGLVTKEIELKAIEYGFNKCIESPLTQESIKVEILEYMEQKEIESQNKIKNINMSMSFIDDFSLLNQFEEK